MRSFLPALLLALTVAAPAAGAERNFGITGYDRVRVDGPYRVRLTTGTAPFARVSGSAAAIDQVAIDVQGRTLIVHTNKSSWGGYPGEAPGGVEVTLGTHDLNAAWLNGAGTLRIDKVKGLSFDIAVQGSGAIGIERVEVDQLRVSVGGTASALVAGQAAKLTALVRGISTLDASGLVTKDATIGAEGPATVRANVTNAVKIDGSGVATITLAGNPACTAKLNGSASVSGCR